MGVGAFRSTVSPADWLALVEQRDRLHNALRNVRDELSHGRTASFDYIDRQFAVLDEAPAEARTQRPQED